MEMVPSLRTLFASRNRTRYPADLQPWGAHASGVVALPDGAVLVNWYGGTCGSVDEHDAIRGDPLGPSRVYLARLEPGASSFGEPEALAGDGKVRFMDANLFFDGERPWAFYVRDGSVQDTVVCRRAEDAHGQQWSPEKVVCAASLARIMNPPIRDNGRILAPLSAFDKDTRHGPWRDAILASSEDNGATWEYTARVEHRDRRVCLREPCLVALPGELQMYMRVCVYADFWTKAPPDDPRWRVMRAVSPDGGLTWSWPQPLDIPNYDSKISVTPLDDGLLLMAHNPTVERFPLMLAASTDRGQTWKTAGVIDPGPGSMSYPTLHKSATGALHLSYTWKRREICYKELDCGAIRASIR